MSIGKPNRIFYILSPVKYTVSISENLEYIYNIPISFFFTFFVLKTSK
ncbi:hypothetical protein LEP1GSC017_0509 [Leptospira meyeri serovar Hardjo str. Went 5]|nr:hypothetical protein LEP1GSC017_0509 [Leptospira meyeri serovar Hardjo str. Went 5]